MNFYDFLKIRKNKNQKDRKAGFTLIGVVIVIVILGIITAVAVPVVTTLTEEIKYRVTLKEMEGLKKAIIGDPELKSKGMRTDFGFAGDIGRFPDNLDELVTQGVLPAWNINTCIGWHGPYIDKGFQEDSAGFKEDGWGNSYVYSNTTGVITSYGSNGVSGGSDYAADFSTEDLTSPADKRYGDITGRITDILGNPLADTAATDVRIRCYYPVNGFQANTEDETDLNGTYQFSNIFLGKRSLEPYVGGEAYTVKTAVVDPDIDTKIDFRIGTDVTIPNPPANVSAGKRAFSYINLDWAPPVQNTDGSNITDLAGYNIYCSTTRGFTPLPSNRIATVGLVAQYVDYTPRTPYLYYYRIRAVDNAGNESANSTRRSNTTANGGNNIKQIVKAAGAGTQYVVVGVKNFSGSAITVTQMNITWSGGSAAVHSGKQPARRMVVRIPSTDSNWGDIHKTAQSSGDTFNLFNSFTFDAYGNPNSEGLLRIWFDAADMEDTTITIQFNPGGSSSSFTVQR